MNETVLVTGGSGYLGGWCIVELLRQGFAVRTTVRKTSKDFASRSGCERSSAQDRLGFVVADRMRDEERDAAVTRA